MIAWEKKSTIISVKCMHACSNVLYMMMAENGVRWQVVTIWPENTQEQHTQLLDRI